MDSVFPFGLPFHLAFYLVLYVLTLVIHAVLMTYVLAGTGWLAFATLFPGQADQPRPARPLAVVLRDWMPFVLSGAITAAIAPLLFVQLVYRPHFYTANLLLGWRWMVVIPVLAAGFYLLYVLKSRTVATWSVTARASLGLCTAGCFLFIAFCWTANHLLSIDRAYWTEAYVAGAGVKQWPTLLLRLGTWVAGAYATMSVLAGWQLAWKRQAASQRSEEDSNSALAVQDIDRDVRRMAMIACNGLVVASGMAIVYANGLPGTTRSLLTGIFAAPWLIAAVAGVVIQLAGWLLMMKHGIWSSKLMGLVTVGASMMLFGTAVGRETIRLAQVDLRVIEASAEQAFQISGFGVFSVFLVLNALLITFCIRIVRRN